MTTADATTHPYDALTPDVVLDAVERVRGHSDGRLLALNSYENRVYQVGMEDGPPLVAKFYRPKRWTDAQIREEHAFTLELAAAEIPVVAPLIIDGETLFEHAGFRYALYPRRGGRAPEPGNMDQLEWLGRFIGRIHAVGSIKVFDHRPKLNAHAMGHESIDFLATGDWLPPYLRANFLDAAGQALQLVEEIFETVTPRRIRLHGDCHPGNILWTDSGPHFVDLDDCLSGPAIQDIWMLLAGSRHEREAQLRLFLSGYEQFHAFDPFELLLVESLRTLRMIHHMGWLARRWDDPAFPAAFTWFNTPRYWEEQLDALREQLDAMQEPPLRLHD
ncbi:MAG TPA: serine/threonine protein kinase [Gammaproteobacteria bacterium]|nr:serine/threonine protein kinase [Gammaproteobacteria bacterium]